jgi:hypothetical protein
LNTQRKREETAIWGAGGSSIFIITEGKTQLSSSEGFQNAAKSPNGPRRRILTLWRGNFLFNFRTPIFKM